MMYIAVHVRNKEDGDKFQHVDAQACDLIR